MTIPDVFSPGQLGPITLRNRTIKSATFEGRTPHGQVTDELIDYHLAVAKGGVGMTTVAYLTVAPEGRTHNEQIVVGPDTRDGLARMAAAIHATGAKIAAQVGHAGPVANGRSNKVKAIAASGMPSPLSMQWIRKAKADDIERVTAAYVSATRTLVDAGFDCLELHMSHSYLISSFLASGLNRRKDEYGGSLENRARLARQVASAVRDEIGNDAAIIAKFSVSDGFKGGVTTTEAVQVAQWLETDGSLDGLELSGGSSLMNPMYLFRGDVPLKEFANAMPMPVRLGMKTGAGKSFMKSYPFEEGYLLEKARQVRAVTSFNLIALGGISSRASMDGAMADGFEFVAMGRALLREPDLVNRLQAEPDRSGVGACIHCNRCMPTIYSEGGTHCTEIPA